MFFRFILIIWTVMHAYLFWRAATVPFIARHVRRGILAGVIAFLWIIFPVSHSLEDSSLGAIAPVLALIGANWLGVAFLLVVTLLAVDVVTAFGLLLRKAAPTLRGWALLVGGLLAAIALVQGSRAPAVRSYEVQIANLPPESNGTVVVVASDLHLGALTGERWVSSRIEQIQAQRPDMVILAGDIVEGHGESEREFLPALRKLSAPLGVWAVNGNHEAHEPLDDPSQSRASLLQEAGIHVLRDQWTEVRPGLILAGVDDLTSRHRHGQEYTRTIDRALAGRPVGATILVSHTPWLAERAAIHSVGLMLCGHTHGGQIWPFLYVVRLIYPLTAGRYDVQGMPVIVCRGTGTWGPRMRLWRRSEILRVVLRARQTSAQTFNGPGRATSTMLWSSM